MELIRPRRNSPSRALGPMQEIAQFHQGDATTLPFPESRFDAAVMALVIFFVLDPAKGVAEMVRVVAPGGTVAAYAWDIVGGGAPQQPIWAEMHTMDVKHTLPPSVEAARMDNPPRLVDQRGPRSSRNARDHCVVGHSRTSMTSGQPIARRQGWIWS